MASKALQQFAGGIFLATAVLSGAYFLSQEESFEAPVSQPLTIEHMKKELESEGFAILPLEELKQIKENQLQDKQEDLDSSDQELVYILFLDITSGMTSNDIADRLVSGQVISDRAAFLQSVEELGLSTSLKTGSFKLSSDMTIDEIIDTIS